MSLFADYFFPAPPPPATVEAGPTPPPAAPRTGRARNFRELAAKLAPVSLAGYWGQRFVGFLGLLHDVRAEAALHGVMSRILFSPLFARDALPLLGSERNLFRYLEESAQDYRMRLYDAWRIWRDAGTEQLLAEQLALVGVGAIEVLRNDQLNYDGDASQGTRVFIVLRDLSFDVQPLGTWGDGHIWGGGSTWGSTLSYERVLELRRIVRAFKPAHVKVEHILIVFDDAALPDPAGLWGDPANRPANILFLDG